jgi:predicted Asp-tRNA(Asn)/Glu-tRNA(Gln) amidotransferase subunit C
MGFMNKESIRAEAKKIIDNFAKKIDFVKEREEESYTERGNDRREEKTGNEGERDFRELMLKNAPYSENGFIITEKGEWVE